MKWITENKKKVLRLFLDMHIAWKFTLAYFIILALPTIVTGFYISNSTTQSIIRKSSLLMKQGLLQKREIINQKIEGIERTSISISYNSRILGYMEAPFQNNYQGLEDYISLFAPLFESYIIQDRNIYDTMLYTANDSFPKSWNGISHMDSIEDEEGSSELLADRSLMAKWTGLHDSKTIKNAGRDGGMKVFSLYRKLISFENKSCLGILELEISEETLFENLTGSNDILEYFLVIDNQDKVVSKSIYHDFPEKYKKNLVPILLSSLSKDVIEFDGKQFALSSLYLDSIECTLIGIASMDRILENNSQYKIIIIMVIFFALIIFVTIIHFVTNHLIRRLKLLVEGFRSVQDESINIKLPVNSRDELGVLTESFNHMTERIHDLIEEVYKARITEKESELKALEAQINPHFLYNALSTISWMARKIKAENIDHLCIQLSQFYRLALSKGNSVITVRDEINLLKAYVAIEKIRFEDMFQVEYDLDEEAFSNKMVKIILQPIAENAIHHGIAPKGEGGRILVKLRQDEENLYFEIKDNGAGMEKSTMDNLNKGKIMSEKKSGYAIHNITERLKSAYGVQHKYIIVTGSKGEGSSVRIIIPKKSTIS